MRILSLFLLALAAQDAPKKPTAEQIEFFRLGMRPVHKVDAREAGAVKAFVEAHLQEEIPSIQLQWIAGDSKDFAELKRLKGLVAINLTGTWDGKPVRTDENGKFYFKAVLSDDAVREIAAIPALKGIWIWYGSLSEAQKKVLLEKHPGCEFHDNLNKL